ncbi:MAG: ABC transporter ATP-binding protein [Candidatus Micrarchaeota archaeon]
MPARDGHVIRFEKVVKEYSLGKRKLRVLDDISFKVGQGEFVAVMGPSGSGKSTMLQMMGCLDRPSAGRVVIDGEDSSALSPNGLADIRARKIGFVFQAFNLLPNMTALQNVEVAMTINEVPRRERLERARRLLRVVGLMDRENHKPNELSGGEKQRVAIARALANKPAFLLADEPTGNLDSKSGNEVMEIIKSLSKQGATVIIVTHEPVVAQYSHRTIRLRDGRIESDGTTARLRKEDLKLK